MSRRFPKGAGAAESGLGIRFEPNNRIRQLEAMMAGDVARHDGGSLAAAARRVNAKLLVVATQDHMVNPGPAVSFAGLLRAPVLELAGPCGHLATGCENGRLVSGVTAFLKDAAR
jgi:homoserine O-acetyltransferase